MKSLFFRNLLFTILQPGIVVGLFPYWLIRNKENITFVQPFVYYHYMGLIIFLIGFVILFACIIRFAIEGKGTISPLDPTKRLVVHGLYKYSRNPMYVGVMLVLIGESVFFRSNSLWWYSLIIFIAFNIFILVHEEPRLKKVFGKEYDLYCKKVRRWF